MLYGRNHCAKTVVSAESSVPTVARVTYVRSGSRRARCRRVEDRRVHEREIRCAMARGGRDHRRPRRDGRHVDGERCRASRVHCPYRGGGPLHRRFGGLRAWRTPSPPVSRVQQAKAALKQAGVNDVKIQIEYSDDATTPEGGVNAARKMISKGADCILGALTSARSIAIAQAATVSGARPADRAEQLVACAHRPERQRLLLPHHALRHAPGADPRAADPGGDGRRGS